MKITYLIIFISLIFNSVFAEEWFVPLDKTQEKLEIACVLITVIDWMQTKNFRSDGIKELNPVLGEEPSQQRVDEYMIAGIITHIFISWALPKKYKDKFIISYLFIESAVVINNYQKGYGVNLTINF